MIYRAGADLHREAYQSGRIARQGLEVPVIVIGNITVGGTGKTPLTIWIAKCLKARGLRVGIISRGYGGITPRKPLEVTAQSSPRLVGDEPVLIQRQTGCPVFVFPRRIEAGRALLRQYPVDVILSDDGLQHHELERDIEIVVVDGERGFGNGSLLPAGPLREETTRIESVDFIVYQGTSPHEGILMELEGTQLVNLQNACRRIKLQDLRGQKVYALAGIGHPSRFFRHLEAYGIELETRSFEDHHRFRAKDLEFAKNAPLLMTEKDAVKCREFARENDWFLPVSARITGNLEAGLLDRLQKIKRSGPSA